MSTNIEVWDIENRGRLVTMEAQHERGKYGFSTISSLVFSPDGKLLASGSRFGGRNRYTKVELWNALTGEHVTTVSTTHRSSIVALVFSDDGKFLASLGGRTIEVWNVVSKELSHSIDAHGKGYWNSLSFSPDGKLLASGGFRRRGFETDIEHSEIKLWDTATGSLVATLSGRGPVVFSPDGKFLASASASETRWVDMDGVEGGTRQGSTIGGSSVKLWDVATRKPIVSFPPGGRINELDFSSDMRLLAESSFRIVRLWDLSEWTGEQTITAVEQAMPQTLTKVSGDGQEGTVGEPLAKPFVVSVLDQDGSAFAGAVVSFSVTAGGGTLSSTTATTDANGRARSTLTLGSDPGTNTVSATVEGLEPEAFTATGQESPFASLFDAFGSGKRTALPDSTQLLPNAPNPFNSQTVFAYFLLEPSLTRLEVFTLTGQRIAVLHQGPQQAGYHRLHWDGRDARRPPRSQRRIPVSTGDRRDGLDAQAHPAALTA